ncbi:MAG TPA: tetratricopeptide repeat protein, partial [Ktedonobacteraceae bacterium]|nr:tetratricopeptide repeat protein [Ktedonobacteraceae bacterium]
MFQQQSLYGNSRPTPIPIHLGAFLKMLRDRHGIAQAEVLQHLPGWHQSAYSKVEKDTRSPTFDQLVPIYNALTQAGVQPSLQDRQQFILLARRKIESRKTRHEHKSDADWEALRVALTDVDQLPVETSKPVHTRPSRLTKPLLVESRHLIGREEWLATIVQRLQNPLQKLLVLQGPVGIGKSSELHRLANHFLHSISHYSVVLCELPPLEQEVLGADIALELLLSDILETIGSPYTSMPTAGLPARVKYVLEYLSRADQSVLILLDNAEQLLDEHGELAPVWKRFLTKFVQTGHHATLVLATKEWPTSFVGETQLIQTTSVPAFSQAEGIIFLQCLGLQYIAEELLGRVVETVGGIPLCLEWVARLVREPMLHNDWADFEEEAGSEAMLTQLFEDGSLFDGPIARRLQPLLDRVVKRLSVEASTALQELAVSPLPLGGLALKTLYQNPAPLKELRDASLLVAYPKRVQLLPMVAASVRSQMSAEQIRHAEERLIEAFTHWLEVGNISLQEQGMVVTELAILLFKHRRLLDAAELLIVMGWLSSNHGHGYRLATFAFEVMNDVDWHADLVTECGGILLRFYLERIRGEKTSRRERAEEFQRLLDLATEQKVSFKLATIAHLLQHIIFQDIGESRFVQVHELLDSYLARINFQSNADVIDMAVPLLNTKAHTLNAQSEQEEQQGHRDEANRLREEALRVAQQCIDLLRKCLEVANPAKKTRILYRLARVLNRVGYFLVNLKRGEEAVKVLEESIDIKNQGYVQAGSLAMSLSELGQAYELLGKFQDALRYNAAALEETQRLAESGHTTAQGDVYVHLVNQARLLLRVGQLEEAERLVNEALPRIPDFRHVYRYKAQLVLEEI